MKNLKVFLLLCFVTLLGTRCRELPLGPLEGDCSDLPPSDSPIGYQYESESPIRYGAHHNPKNGDQFVFIEYYPELSRGDLYSFDLLTREKKLLISSVSSPGRWSNRGWIITTGSDGRLRKIKETGDSLTVIDNGFSEFFPIWNPEGTQIVVRRSTPSKDVQLILDDSGNIIDSIPRGAFEPLCWLESDKIYGGLYLNENQGNGFSTRTVGYYDLTTRQLIPVYEVGEYLDPSTFRLNMTGDLEKRLLYWTNMSGFYRTEIETGKTVLLLQNCQTRNREFVSLSPDGKMILSNLAINQKVDDNLIRSSVKLVEYDTNGMELDVLDF